MLLETSVPGIFAAGDVRHGSVKGGICRGRGFHRHTAYPQIPELSRENALFAIERSHRA